MKTLITLLCLVGATGFSFAGNGERILSKKIHTKIHYPTLETAKQVEAIVNVTLSVSETGTVCIEHIESTDETVIASITHQITEIKLKPDAELVGKTFAYRFILKVQ